MDADLKDAVKGAGGLLAWIGADRLSAWLGIGVAMLTIVVLMPRALASAKNTWLLLAFWRRQRQQRPLIPPSRHDRDLKK
jgi:hypothetical protein